MIIFNYCDLKPSSIILDAEMTAHVGDFGLARILSASDIILQVSSVGLRGTIGYSPPGYGLGREASRKGDVYSYSNLLLEMFTGKRPTDDMFKDAWNIRSYCEAALLDRAGDIADPVLLCNEFREGSISHAPRKIEECPRKLFEVGIGVAESHREKQWLSAKPQQNSAPLKLWWAEAPNANH